MTLNNKKIIYFILGFSLLLNVYSRERPFIQTKEKRITADKVTSDINGVLTFQIGSLKQKIKPTQYIYARIPLPPEIASAFRKLKLKKYSDTVKGMDSAYRKYRFVGWDIFCIYYSAFALEKAGKKDAAIKKLELIKSPPIDKKKNKNYYNAMKLLATLYIEKGSFDKAEKVLASIGEAEDPEIFAFVNNSRGDILSKRGESKDALIMYMRTIMFCTKDNNKKERPEALVKAIKILKENKNNRYLDFEKTLKADYPGFSM